MAINITSNYSGEVLEELLTKVTTGNEAVQSGLFYIKDGIKGKYNIPKLKGENFVTDYVVTPTGSTGNFTVTEKVLEPQKYMVYTTFKPEDFEDYWKDHQPTGPLVFQELPADVQSAFLTEIIEDADSYMGSAVWNGDMESTDLTRHFDGIIKRALEDADVIDIDSPVALTASNIEAELNRVYKATPQAVRQHPDFKFIVSVNTYDLYEEAQYAKTNKGKDVTDEGLKRFRGKTIVPLVAFPDDCILATKASATKKSNLWMGVSSLADGVTINVDRVANNSEEYFFKMILKVDTQLVWGDETVLYRASEEENGDG